MGNLENGTFERTLQTSNVAVFDVNITLSSPELMASFMEIQMAKNPQAIVLRTNATGSVPDKLIPFIEECTAAHRLVFLLPKVYGEPQKETGNKKTPLAYPTTMAPVQAGAILLRTTNVEEDLPAVVQAIHTSLNSGATPAEVRAEIIRQFGKLS